MINILVTDDDPNIRESIHTMLTDHYGSDNITIFEAADGLKALETIASVNIHILLTDIKMPSCSGLELMSRLKDFNFQGLTIVLSGFDDYSLVRDAMKLGATDYLLKPISNEEFYSLFDKSIREIRHRQSYISNHQDERSIDVKKLYENQYNIDSLFNPEINRDLFASVGNTPCIITIIDLSKEEKVRLEYIKTSYFKHCQEYFAGQIASPDNLVQGERAGYWMCLLKNMTESSYEYIQPFLADCTNKGQKACCSDIFPLSSIETSFNECLRRIDNIFYNMPKLPPTSPEKYPYSKHCEAVESSASDFNLNQFLQSLHELMLQINYDKCPVADTRKLLQELIYHIMQKNTKYIRIIGQYKMSENDILLGISEAFCLTQLQEEFTKDFSLYMQGSDGDEGAYIRRAKEFISAHFAEDISLNDVSGALSLHPNYFSSLFRKSCDCTFVEYIRKIRIEKAIELMESSDLKLYEIAERVGYNDTVSFNRAFSKETGRTPSEYRKH